MKPAVLYVRFYRSFNFDFVRKANPKVEPLPWEMVEGAWYPFVRISLDPVVTAIVGANESGKSHLIGALRAALTGDGFDEGDFCRYSDLYSVEQGKRRIPDFGLRLDLAEDDQAALAAVGLDLTASLTLLRLNGEAPAILGPDGEVLPLTADQRKLIEGGLPTPFSLETDVAVPTSVSFDVLTGRNKTALSERKHRSEVLEALEGIEDVEQLRGRVDQVGDLLRPRRRSDEEERALGASNELARTLLVDVARIEPSAFEDLFEAIQDGKEGGAGALIDSMNQAIAQHLNLSSWWSQDEEFQLRIDVRERELVFTVRDRTGTSYSFDERSRGLRYFLGYYVQLKAHESERDPSEILLMDEPDAYLSNLGQQDLLRLFENFAQREGGDRGDDQVVYVTHSPFLINKNAAHRLRVLDKGSDEEGTRVVRDGSQNHYEPVRSSVGTFVAETAFIGGSNLFVEGIADQIVLSAATALLRDRGVAPGLLLDLNVITIVPCGGAPHIPYMTYLARGRDEIKPACVALFDGDKEGKDSASRLRASEIEGWPVLDDELIIDIEAWANSTSLKISDGVAVSEIEDLIPRQLMIEAAKRYANRFMDLDESATSALKSTDIKKRTAENEKSHWRGMKAAFADAFNGAQIDKVGFTRELADLLDEARLANASPAGIEAFAHNLGALIRHLAERLEVARDAELEIRRGKQIKGLVKSFARDHPSTSRRDEADAVLRAIERSLAGMPENEVLQLRIATLRSEFELSPEDTASVAEYPTFLENLRNLRHMPKVAREAS